MTNGSDPLNTGTNFGSVPLNLLVNAVAWFALIVSPSLWITLSDSILADVVLYCPQEPAVEAYQQGEEFDALDSGLVQKKAVLTHRRGGGVQGRGDGGGGQRGDRPA